MDRPEAEQLNLITEITTKESANKPDQTGTMVGLNKGRNRLLIAGIVAAALAISSIEGGNIVSSNIISNSAQTGKEILKGMWSVFPDEIYMAGLSIREIWDDLNKPSDRYR